MFRIGFALAVMVAAAAQAQTGEMFRDRRGASLQLPAGWRASADPDSTRMDVRGPAGERMVIWPVFFGEGLNAQSAAAMLPRVGQKIDPGMAWGAALPVGAAMARMGGRANGQAAVLSVTWVNSPRGAAAYFVMSAAPQAQFAATTPAFARIFASLKITPPAGGSGPALQSVRWNEPREQAFSVELPAQWRVDGGTVRRASVDVVHTWAATSPDGAARIHGGDANIPAFTLPNEMLTWAGFREGSWYSPGYGVRQMVQRYMPGLAFAQWYVQSKAAQGCSSLQFTQQQDRTRDFAAINAQYAQFRQAGMNLQVTAGEVSFMCQRGGRPMAGYYFVTTVLANSMQTGVWGVDQLFGYVANASAEPQAQAALQHAIESFHFNPQWLQMQSNITMQTSHIVSQTQTEIAQMAKSSFEYRQRVTSEAGRKSSNATLGLVDAIDPVSGKQFKVDNTSNYNWIDVNGRITGTQTNTQPAGIDPRLMVTLP